MNSTYVLTLLHTAVGQDLILIYSWTRRQKRTFKTFKIWKVFCFGFSTMSRWDLLMMGELMGIHSLRHFKNVFTMPSSNYLCGSKRVTIK